MSKTFQSTAGGIVIAIFMAVFFSPSVYAYDGSLYSLESSLNDLIFHLSRSVVTIEASVDREHSGMTPYAGSTDERTILSGVVWGEEGHIITSAKAIAGFDKFLVRFDGGTLPAHRIAIDFQSDLALLKSSITNATPAIYNESQACAGQMVVAIGNDFGIRAAPAIGFCAGVREDGITQFSVPLAAGTVGGGIFDLSGQLLGVITSGMGKQSRVALAVPAHKLPAIVEYLLTYGDRLAGFMGVTSREIEITPGIQLNQEVSLASSEAFPITVIKRGVAVVSVVPNSPAQRAGLEVGDLLFAVDGIAVNSAAGLAAYVQQSPPGTSMEFDLLRHDRWLTVPLTVGRKEILAASRPRESRGESVVDSLTRAFRLLQEEMIRIERKLYELD